MRGTLYSHFTYKKQTLRGSLAQGQVTSFASKHQLEPSSESRNVLLTTLMECLLECQAWKESEKSSAIQILHGIDKETT